MIQLILLCSHFNRGTFSVVVAAGEVLIFPHLRGEDQLGPPPSIFYSPHHEAASPLLPPSLVARAT